MQQEAENSEARVHGAVFATTHWSVVLAAGEQDTPQSNAALEQLCRIYWYPIYVFIRRQGHDESDAQDLTQGFFTHMLSRRSLHRADPGKGRFRSFMIGSLRYFLADELAKLQAKKRGGGRTMVSLDARAAEERYGLEPVDDMDAERLFERRWAITLLERAMERLEQEFVEGGKRKGFELLREFLLGDQGRRTYQDAATELGMTEGAVKVAVHRLRLRYREIFREEISQTLADPAETEAEIRHVFAVVSQ